MKTKATYLVTFRNSYDKLTCMFTEKFTSIKDAKAAIECDGAAFKDAHQKIVKYEYTGNLPWNAKLPGHRTYARWVHPETEDYYEVRGRDGQSCVWQYFKI